MGSTCTATGLGYTTSAATNVGLLEFQVQTKGTGPFSPYGVSYGVGKVTEDEDGATSASGETPLSGSLAGPGFEGGGQTYRSLHGVALDDECTFSYVMSKYDDAALDVAVTLDGVALDEEEADDRILYSLTNCSLSSLTTRSRRLSGGGIFGVIVASLVLCCGIAALLNYLNEYYTDRMADMSFEDSGSRPTA